MSDRIAKEDYVDTAVATKASATLTSAHVLVGNVSNVATDVAVSGDVTITNAGVTAIGASKVTNAMIAAVDGAKITTGTVPIARLPTGTGSSNVPLGGVITGSGPTGDASHTLALTYNAAGQLTAVTNNAISVDAAAIASGTIAIARIPTGTTSSTVPLGGVITAAGPQGDATHTQVLTWNAAGQVTTVTNTAIALAATGDVTGTLPGATTLVGTANVESIIRANSLDQFAAAAANVNLNSNRIINVTDPSSAQDAMTLQYANTTYAPKASPTFTGTVTAPIVNASGLVTASADLAVSGATSSTTALLSYGLAATYTATQTIGDTNVANRFATTASMQHFGFRMRDTDTWAVTPAATGAHVGYADALTIVNDSATSFDYVLAYTGFSVTVTQKVDTQTGRNFGTAVDFSSAPTFTAANSGTFTAGAHSSFSTIPVLTAATGCTLTSTTAFKSGLTVSSGTVTTRTGLLVSEATGAGTLTNQIGVDIVALTKGGTTNVGLRNASSTQLGNAQQCTVDITGNIATTGTLSVTGHATLEGVTSTGATGTGNLAFSASPTFTGTVTAAALTATGAFTQGSSGQLTSDASGNFATTGSITTGAAFNGTSVTDTLSGASSTIGITSLVRRLNNTSGGALTITAAPTIADGTAGQIMILINTSANNVVLQDQGTLASSNLRLGASTRTLGQRDNMILLYNATVGDWVELTFNNVI